MPMELNFGLMGGAAPSKTANAGAPFRIAVLGDFSAGANKGRLETGDDLAGRKPLKVDVDNLDAVIERLEVSLSLPIGEGAVEIPFAAMDDFHPDQLYEKVELFTALAGLRQRLGSKTGFEKAAKDLLAWQKAAGKAPKKSKAKKRSRSSSLPRGGKLSDFAALIGRPTAEASAADVAIEALLKQAVAPYIVEKKDPKQAELVAVVDQALSETMRQVLHHPDFQTLESLWRSVDQMTRRIETSTKLQIVLYDISIEELAADLSATDELEETGIYKLLVDQPAHDAHQGALSVFIGAYTFDMTPPQAELLGRIAKVAARGNAPFISALSTDVLKTPQKDIHPLIEEAWDGLRALEEAKYLSLVLPRFLLRQPYGAKTDPIDPFEFEEFTRSTGLGGMLWGNPAFIAGLLIGETFAKQGAKMNIGSVMSVGDIPYYFFTDDDGDQIALPCTERLVTQRQATELAAQNLAPLLSIKGRPEVRLGGFTSLAGKAIVGRWPEPTGNVIKPKPAPPPPPKAEGEGEEGSSSDEFSFGDDSSSSSDLDSLMSGLDDTPSETMDEPAADDSGGTDPDLDELLKSLG